MRYLFRFPYSFTAVAVSMLGMLEFGLFIGDQSAVRSALGQSDKTGIAIVLWVYEISILALALIQVPVHGSVLFPMRWIQSIADSVTERMGKGNLRDGIERYYDALNVCNYALTMVVAWGVVTLGLAWQAGIVSTPFKVVEIIRLALFGAVVIARWVAKALGKERDWFYAAWSIKP